MGSNAEIVPITSQKHDPAWKHCQMFKNGDKVHLQCLYCSKVFKGGGIHRIKEHLAGQKGNASTCLRVPAEVKTAMQQSLDGVVVKKKKKKQKIEEEIASVNRVDSVPEGFAGNCQSGDDEFVHFSNVNETSSSALVGGTLGNEGGGKKRRISGSIMIPIATAGVDDCTTLVEKRVGGGDGVQIAIARFLYDIGAPLSAVNSDHFQPMVDAIASGGPNVVPPSYHDVRGWILKGSVEVKSDVNKQMETLERTGCSVLVDQRNTSDGRTLLSFLVSCPERVVFVKSVDASDTVNSPDRLYELLRQVVEEVGVQHILQVITGVEDRYVIAGKKLSETFPTLYWSPCAAHCIDLILNDFGKLEWINGIIEKARSITRFVYNHTAVVNMLRRYTFGIDILQRGLTRSATNFVTLKQMVDLKDTLQGMVTSYEWIDCPFSKQPGGLEMLDLVSDQSFWSSCTRIVRLTQPLLRVLRIICDRKRPPMGYVYAGMYRVKEEIKKEFLKREDYVVYWNIIDQWWEGKWNVPLRAAGFYLNPKFFYSIKGNIHGDIQSGLFDCIERLVPEVDVQAHIITERNSYKNASSDFGRRVAVRTRETMLPDEWWATYGGSCPNLTRLAIRILNQACSSIGYKQDDIPIERVHDTKNGLEHQRLSDLVFYQYNSRLRDIMTKKEEQDTLDPLSYENVRFLEDWVNSKDVFIEESMKSDWAAIDPPHGNKSMLGGHSEDYINELETVFDDAEIFSGAKEGMEETIEENVAR
ncbi:unnamed protein product [Linum trigynum]|uniref:BED-type domain-containing protein n=1 Tax=Linum trigynum TaxID=586398 RepID=A0AAV2ESG8_9ROSI